MSEFFLAAPDGSDPTHFKGSRRAIFCNLPRSPRPAGQLVRLRGGGAACVPGNDQNPCTDDVCENGLPVHHATPAGSPRGMGCAQRDGVGSCLERVTPADCSTVDNPLAWFA